MGLNQLGRFVEFVPESKSKVIELIRELSCLDNKTTRRRLEIVCLSLIKSMPESMREIVDMLWTLCEDGERHVRDAARGQVVRIMLSRGEIEDHAINSLLRLSEGEPKSAPSSLVQLIAIAQRLVVKTPDGVDCLLSSLSREDLRTRWYELTFCIRDLIGRRTKKEMGLHMLHFMTVKALQLPEVEDQELHMLIDTVDSDPINIRVKSAKFMGSAQCPFCPLAPIALGKLALNCPEYEEDLVNSIDDLSQDEDGTVGREAYVHMFSLLERLPHKAERVLNRLQESLHLFKCFDFLRMRESVSLNSLLKTYMKCHNNFLIFWIVWKVFDTPVTMETRSNGKLN